MKGATLFSGFGGVDIGMKAAGIGHAWGIEYDDAIAAVARQNGFNTITADILDCDPRKLERVNLLHASPPCPNFSVAKAGGVESENDLALARKVIEFIRVMSPEFFTLENVYGYRKSYSMTIVYFALLDAGYYVDGWKLNAADYGVAQTRERLFIVARKDKPPVKPTQTHYKKKAGQLSMFTKPWIGWYEAIEDLIPTLPDSQFAPWQLKRLPDWFEDHFAPHTQANSGTDGRYGRDPITTIAAQKQPDKAFIIGQGDRSAPVEPGQPYNTVTANSNQTGVKAFVMPGSNGSSARPHQAAEPSFTIGDTRRVGNIARAFIVNDSDSKNPFRNDGNPAATILASGAQFNKAFITDRCNGSATSPNRMEDEPAQTIVCYSPKHQEPNGFVNGRIAKLTPRALARLQSFPDWYQLPEKASLACKGIGNAVPPLLYQRIAESLK